MPIPDKPLLWLCAAWFVLGLASIFVPEIVVVWEYGGALALVIVLADLLAGRQRLGCVSIRREVPHALPVGTWQTVSLRLTTQSRVCGWLSDHHPAEFQNSGLPLFFRLQPGRWLKAGYRLLVTERGKHEFKAVDLRLCSPLRLWLVSERLEVRSEVRVYPNFAKITQYTLLATDNRLSQIGVLQRRRRGEGMEFHQLRDYRQEDSPRQIDWKASSRMGRLISREYQDERDQQIVFLLDCGSRMRARDGELSHFDHTLNAMLLLSYVALGQGDAVGLSTFGHDKPRFLPPRKSVTTVNRLLNAVYDLEPTLQTPDYLVAAEALQKHLTKRTLIILLTNVRDEDDDTLRPAMTLLRKRHAVTLASLKEAVLEELIDDFVRDFDGALTRAAALEYVHSRRRQAAMLRHGGVQIVDVSPQQMPVALINHYWERKRAGAI